ncbi:hypothetical protein TNCV_2431651 [Trichonephila clavipes]|nr:hypothetical protein TNCV_2431651 [Trichonephila clavipes]
MDAYILDFADGTRVANVYQKWLTWLDVWEMHRDDNVPWHMVGLQHLKRALENTCRARMKRLWPMLCHLTLRSSSLYKTSNQPLELFCFSQIEATSLFRVNQPILLMPTCFITMASQCSSNCPLPRFPGMAAIPK